LQAEFSLTQVLDRPAAGRLFFEEIIRENFDIGRPSHVQLIFGRRVNTRTPGRFRTRVITEGVIPSLHVDYKSSRIKQYFKLNCALRTETTINNTRDFRIGKRLKNLPRCGRSAFKPIDVPSTSRPSLTTASLANEPTSRSCVQSSVTVNGLPPCASTIGASKRCSLLWSCSARISTAFAIGNCEST
jgi:hypothetical protein